MKTVTLEVCPLAIGVDGEEIGAARHRGATAIRHGGIIPPRRLPRTSWRGHAPYARYFFTVRIHRRQTFFTDADVGSALREAIGTLRLTHPFVIEALLPDHMHALWILPPGDEDFPHRWRVVKRMVTQRCETTQST